MVHNNDNLLINAAGKGDLSKVKKLLKKGSNINAKNDKDSTPLHFAVGYGYLSVIEKLLKEGAGINIKNSYDYTPLELAERYKRLEVVNFFRKKQQERPVQRKRRHHHACHHIGEQKYLQRKEHSIYLELEGTDHSVKNGNPTIKNDHAISGTSNPSLWTNDLFGWVKSFVSGLLGSEGTASLISQVNVPNCKWYINVT